MAHSYSHQDWNEVVIGGNKNKNTTNKHTNNHYVKRDEDGEVVNNTKKVPFSLSKNIQKARTLKGWTQTELASKVGVNVKVISEWESGKVNVDQKFVQKLEKAFNLYLQGTKAMTSKV